MSYNKRAIDWFTLDFSKKVNSEINMGIRINNNIKEWFKWLNETKEYGDVAITVLDGSM